MTNKPTKDTGPGYPKPGVLQDYGILHPRKSNEVVKAVERALAR